MSGHITSVSDALLRSADENRLKELYLFLGGFITLGHREKPFAAYFGTNSTPCCFHDHPLNWLTELRLAKKQEAWSNRNLFGLRSCSENRKSNGRKSCSWTIPISQRAHENDDASSCEDFFRTGKNARPWRVPGSLFFGWGLEKAQNVASMPTSVWTKSKKSLRFLKILVLKMSKDKNKFYSFLRKPLRYSEIAKNTHRTDIRRR